MQDLINTVFDQISLLRIADAIDIFLVAVIVYYLLRFIRDSHTTRLLKGVVLIVIGVQVVFWANLHVMSYILTRCVQVGVIALIVIFQSELRRALDTVGKTSFSNWFTSDTETDSLTLNMITEVSHAVNEMSKTKTGALIVIEQGVSIDSMISSGIKLDAIVSSEILMNIFVHNTPLHDGAVIIRDNRILMATSVLPLSNSPYIKSELGTRHRAAIGISEEANVVVIVVSEETGLISLAYQGELFRDFYEDTLKTRLEEIMINPDKVKNADNPKSIKDKLFKRKES